MRLFLLPKEFNGTDTITLTGKNFNYIVKVLRLKENASLTGRDAAGNAWNLTILHIGKASVTLSAVRDAFAKERTDALPENRPRHNIILYQCLPKGRKMDEIVKRGTEIGVCAIVPVKSGNCIANLEENRAESRSERYEALIKEAVEQSGSLVPTRIGNLIDIKDVSSDFKKRSEAFGEPAIGLILHQCSLKEDQRDLVSVLKGFKGTVGVLVGPEGGFTDSECSLLMQEGFKPVLLRTNILRCETAAIYALSAVQALIETSEDN